MVLKPPQLLARMKTTHTKKRTYLVRFKIYIPVILAMLATSPSLAQAQTYTVTNLFSALLTNSGSSSVLPILADATDPSEHGLTPALKVNQPNALCPKLLNVVNPSIALPTNSSIRQIQALFNDTPLPLIDDRGKIIEEAHSYGSTISFWRPLFSVQPIPAGTGVLTIKGYDAGHALVATVNIPNLEVAKSPAAVAASDLAELTHPRLYLTPERLAAAKARSNDDPAAKRFWGQNGIGAFLDALKVSPDPEAKEFVHYIWDPEDYIPALSLCYQLKKDTDPTTAAMCADAAKRMTLKMAADYASGVRSFARDTGYDIRFGLRNLMLSYDWLYTQYSPTERTQIVDVATKWVDWYTNNPGYSSTNPMNNYYAGYLQGLTLTALGTAGDNNATDRLLALLRSKLASEVSILNQRACGDWPEGWSYGPYTLIEYTLVNQTLKDVGENWDASFDFLKPIARGLTYQVTPDFSQTISFGGYAGNLPHKTSPALLAVLSGATGESAAASRLYQKMLANSKNDWSESRGNTMYEMIFGNFTQQANVNGWPLSHLNPGTGRFFSLSSLSDTGAYQVITENTNAHFDHYGYSNGDVRLYRGTTCLLCPSAYRGDNFDGEASTPAFSTYLVNGKVQSQNRNNQILFTAENGTWSAIGMRLESSWAIGRYDENYIDARNPLNYLIREVVHIRPGTVIVRDLHERRHNTDTLVANWHLGSSAAVQTVNVNQYKIDNLNISTFYPTGVKTTFANDKDGGGNRVGTLMQQNLPSSAEAMEMITVFSESVTGVSYSGGQLRLSDNTCVTFASGKVSVHTCGSTPATTPTPTPTPPIIEPAPTPTPVPAPTPAPNTIPKPIPLPVPPPSLNVTNSLSGIVKAGVNLLADPYFEKSASGFFAQDTTDFAVRTTTRQLYGAGSLRIKLNSNGNHIWWRQTAKNMLAYGGSLQLITSVRPDLQSNTPLRVCAAVYYADGGFVKQCTTPSKTKNRISRVVATLKIDAKRTLQKICVLLYNDGPGPVVYTLDNVSLKLNIFKPTN